MKPARKKDYDFEDLIHKCNAAMISMNFAGKEDYDVLHLWMADVFLEFRGVFKRMRKAGI